MTAQSAPVPSKNALRALRGLALGAPGLLVGAVGSTCGLVAVNCEAWRRSRLAEKIVERKRTLASITNGRSSSRVRRMFEAAERGEDFLLDAGNRDKRRQKRIYSQTAATIQHKEDDVEAMVKIVNRRADHHGNTETGSKSADTRGDLGQRAPAWRSQASLKQVPDERDSPSSSRAVRSAAECHPPSEQPTPGRSASRLHPSNKAFAATRFESNTGLSSLGRRFSQSNEGSGPTSTQHEPGDRYWNSARYQTLQQNYARDLRESPVERIRLSSMKLMKQGDHSVYARQTNGTSAGTSPINHNVAREINGPSQIPPLDLAPRMESRSLIAPIVASKSPQMASVANSGSTTVSSDDALTVDGAGQPRHPIPRQMHMEIIESPFADWPGLVQQLSGIDSHSDPDRTTKRDNTAAVEEPDMFGDDIDISSIFTLAHEMVETDLSNINATELHPTQQDVLAKSTLDNVKHSNAHHPEILSDKSFESSTAVDMFSVPQPTLGKQGQAVLNQVLQEVGYDLYAEVCIDVMRHGHSSRRISALSKKLSDLVEKGSEQDLKLAELLFHALFKSQQKSSRFLRIPNAAMNLAYDLFRQNLPGRAASILFPYNLNDTERLHDRSRETGALLVYRNANNYLEMRCDAIQDPLLLCAEARQVLRAATYMEILPGEYPIDYLILPTIRALCARGEEAQAVRLLKEIEEQYKLNYADTIAARQVLILAFANRNNVVQVKVILEDLHAHGASRKHVQWFSNLFGHVFQRHLLHNPLPDSYDLLVHAMAFCGLMPDSRVSSALISACLKDERYDFIQEYVQAVRQLYPFLDLGTTGPLCAWHVARAWKEMKATCEQVQKGCLAMAYCANSDPFGKSLRDVAEEAVRLDISGCLSILMSIRDGQNASDIYEDLRFLDFDEIIEKARKMVREAGPPTKPYLRAKSRLLDQIQAVTRLNRLFGGDHMGDEIETSTRHRSALKQRLQYQDRGNQGDFAAKIFQERDILPERETLWKLMAKHYAYSQRRGFPADHDLLRHVVPEMMRLQRTYEAAQLVHAVHQSPYVSGSSGTSFGEEMLNLWFEISVHLSSPKVMKQALWAFIETTDNIIVSKAFLIRVEMACKKVMGSLTAVRVAKGPDMANHELQYLVGALKTRYARQVGVDPDEERQLWNEYKSWEELTAEMPKTGDEDQKDRAQRAPDQPSSSRSVEAVQAC